MHAAWHLIDSLMTAYYCTVADAILSKSRLINLSAKMLMEQRRHANLRSPLKKMLSEKAPVEKYEKTDVFSI